MKPALKIGVTGGIGSGKTSVCRVFNILGIPVFTSDSEASRIMETDESIVFRLNTIAGKNLYIGGKLDRQLLASLIFNDELLLKKVNSLVHPIVFDHFRKWLNAQTSPYVIMEAAILFESGASTIVDKVITVVAPIEERVDRIINRNKLTRLQVLERMRNQMDDDSRVKLSDYVIKNSENDLIIPAILQIHQELLKYINSDS